MLKPEIKLWEYNKNCFSLFFIIEVNLSEITNFLYADVISDQIDCFANSWVTHRNLDNGLVQIDCSLIHPKKNAISDFYIELYDENKKPVSRILISDLQKNQNIVTSGLISYHKTDHDNLAFSFWSQDKDTSYQLGTKLFTDAQKNYCESSSIYYSEIKTSNPLDRNSITCLPTYGDGQKFAHNHSISSVTAVSDQGISNLKDIHKGKVGWLIGNGPSVRTEDLDLLKDEITFGFNRFHLAFNKTKLRPTYTLSGDEQVISDFGQEIVDANDNKVFISSVEKPSLTGDYHWVKLLSMFPSLFSLNPDYFVTPGGSSVYMAMQLAHHMGISKLYFYGADFNFNFQRDLDAKDPYRQASGDGNHFIDNYRSGKAWCPPAIRNIANSFWGARCLMEANGGFIKNVTHGGLLEVFERQSITDALIENHIISKK